MDAQERANRLIEKANALHAQGRPVAAIPLYREAADLFPPYASFNLVAADLLVELGQLEEAAGAYEAVLQTHPEHDQAAASLADLRRQLDGGRPSGRMGRWFGRH